MSNSDKEVLEEFETWRAELIGNGADLSVAAFLKERENDHNRLRIAGALRVLDQSLSHLEFDEPWEPNVKDAKKAIRALQDVRNVLVGDREYMEDRSLDGKLIRRDYV